MKERKIHNYPSEILRDMTFEKEGHFPESLGAKSNKFIYAACRVCGQPSRLRNAQYQKSKSACHKECRFKEQKQSPFSDPAVRTKAAQTNLKKYGTEHASSNPEIAKKISSTKKTEISKQKSITTNMQKYGVPNPFQSDQVKQKIKTGYQQRLGVDHPLQSDEIKSKVRNTLQEKYGIDNLMDNAEFANKARKSFNDQVKEDADGMYVVINFLRSEGFWKQIELGKSLREICELFNLPYPTLATTLSRDEFRDRFRQVYSYPKHQKQNEMSRFIQSLGLSVEMSNRSIIYPKELDIYVPDKKIAIELNGSYWHSEAILDTIIARNKHRFKLDECRKQGVRLISVFELLWDTRKEQVKNFIRSSLGANTVFLDARKCQITNNISKQFIDANHIQKYPLRTIMCFNLEFEGRIVGSITSAEHHRKVHSGRPILLSRMCFADNTTIRGGATRLFSAFKEWSKGKGYDRIISFSDNCWTEGAIYTNLGFQIKKESTPDYFYWNMADNRYVSKQSQRKSNIGCPADITEREWCFKNGLYRIWDCGKKLWEYKL